MNDEETEDRIYMTDEETEDMRMATRYDVITFIQIKSQIIIDQVKR